MRRSRSVSAGTRPAGLPFGRASTEGAGASVAAAAMNVL
jgi:hypothetical protein